MLEFGFETLDFGVQVEWTHADFFSEFSGRVLIPPRGASYPFGGKNFKLVVGGQYYIQMKGIFVLNKNNIIYKGLKCILWEPEAILCQGISRFYQ